MKSYRLIYLGLSLAFVAVVAAAFALNPRQEPVDLPDAVVTVFPQPNDAVLRQTTLEVTMQPGYSAVIYVDGARIPDQELLVIPGAGRYQWRPGPTQLFEEWTLGDHTVRLEWNTVTGLPDAGEFEWNFRVQ